MTLHPDPGELLSAYLDGEVSDDERATVEALLRDDPAARQALADLSVVRGALRSLPAVDPPVGTDLRPAAPGAEAGGAPANAADVVAPVADLAEHRRNRGARRRWPLAVGGAAAAAVVVVGGLVVVGGDDGGGGDDPMVPPVTEFASRHDAMAELVATGATTVPPMPGDFEELDPSAMGADAPAELPSGFERMAGFRSDDGTMHVVYTHDDMAVSVYRQEGQVDFAALPATGQAMEMEGAPGWLHTAETPRGTEEIMVLQHGDTVYTFVAAVPHEAMVSVVEDVAFS